MHGGKIFIRTESALDASWIAALPAQVTVDSASKEDIKEIEPVVNEFAEHFALKAKSLLSDKYLLLRPNAKNPYKQLYTAN
jgi:hypothetical protein